MRIFVLFSLSITLSFLTAQERLATTCSATQFKSFQKLNSYFYYGEIESTGSYVYRCDPSSGKLNRINYRLFDTKIYNDRFVIIQQYTNGPKGILDIDGNEILPTFYSNVWIKDNYFIGELNSGLFIYNQKGEKIFPEPFNFIDSKNKYIYVKVTDNRFPNKEKFVVYNPELKPITKDNWTIDGRIGKDDLLLIKSLDNQTFYCDHTGEIQIKPNPKLNYISPFSNGYAIVSSKKNPEKFGFIDTKGKVVIPIEYDEVAPFQSRYAYFVKKENNTSTEGLIDSQNKIVKIFPAKVLSKSIYYDSNEITYYLSNLETYDADGNFKEDLNLIR